MMSSAPRKARQGEGPHGPRITIAWLCACALGLMLLLAPMSTGRAEERTITLLLGSGSVLTLERPFETVLVDDADVVSVRVRDDRSVILNALKLGTSNIIFVDAQSIAIANVRVVVSGARA
jgi:Flp pilus assembly secretin CpaC